jgi:hypothetical protein
MGIQARLRHQSRGNRQPLGRNAPHDSGTVDTKSRLSITVNRTQTISHHLNAISRYVTMKKPNKTPSQKTSTLCYRPTWQWAQNHVSSVGTYEMRCLSFPREWGARLKHARLLACDYSTSPVDDLWRHQLRLRSAFYIEPVYSLVNQDQFAIDLAQANGQRKLCGVLTLNEIIELGLGSLPALNSERIIQFAAPLRNHRPVARVTCVVLEKLPEEGKVLGLRHGLTKMASRAFWHGPSGDR